MIIFFAVIFTITMVMGVLTVDLGLWLSDRRAVVKAADLAALAGSQDLPADDQLAIDNAKAWAKRNGYEDGKDGVTVTPQLFCSNTLTHAVSGICRNPNPSSPDPAPCSVGQHCDAIRVTIRKPGAHIFSSFFGMGEIKEGSAARATLSFDLLPLDTVLALDSTYSMRYPACDSHGNPDGCCNSHQDNPGCPIQEAKDAASNFTDILLPEDNTLTQVGLAPYRDCYIPPRQNSSCVPAGWVIPLTTDAEDVHDGIDIISADGNTNICLALWQSDQVLSGANAQEGDSVRRYVVILSDGDNNYSASTSYGQGQPPLACRPDYRPWENDGYNGSECRPGQTRERQLDTKTLALADQLAADGVEIFVVGFSVCSHPNSAQGKTPGYCNGVGNPDHDNAADRRLLKCIASSTEGTNDHYFEVESASELPEIFQIIAWQIAGRALTE